MSFEEIANRYRQLREQVSTGQISPQQFESLVSDMRFQSSDGAWWVIRAGDGVWMHWNGSTWEATAQRAMVSQPAVYASPPQIVPRPKSSPSCLKTLGIGCLVFLCLVITLGIAGYFLITSGKITTMQIATAFGPGVGEVQIINLSDDTLDVRLTRLDTEDGSPDFTDSASIESMLVNGFGAVESGRYQVDFSTPSGMPSDGICIFKIKRSDFYQFWAVPDGIIVTLNEKVPDDGMNLTISTSSLCDQ